MPRHAEVGEDVVIRFEQPAIGVRCFFADSVFPNAVPDATERAEGRSKKALGVRWSRVGGHFSTSWLFVGSLWVRVGCPEHIFSFAGDDVLVCDRDHRVATSAQISRSEVSANRGAHCSGTPDSTSFISFSVIAL